jgi:hypothetical protein
VRLPAQTASRPCSGISKLRGLFDHTEGHSSDRLDGHRSYPPSFEESSAANHRSLIDLTAQRKYRKSLCNVDHPQNSSQPGLGHRSGATGRSSPERRFLPASRSGFVHRSRLGDDRSTHHDLHRRRRESLPRLFWWLIPASWPLTPTPETQTQKGAVASPLRLSS